MKPYHEIGHIKDGNKRVGFVIKQGGIADESDWIVLQENQFCEYVRRGLVQYFEWDSTKNNYMVKYSDGEIALIRKMGSEPKDKGEYFKSDVCMQIRYLQKASTGEKILFLPMAIHRIVGKTLLVSGYMVGMGNSINSFISYVRNSGLKSSLIVPSVGGNNAVVKVAINKHTKDVWDKVFETNGVIVDTSSLNSFRYQLKDFSKRNSMLVKVCTEQDIDNIEKFFSKYSVGRK